MSSSRERPSIGAAIIVWRDESRNELLLGLGHSPQNRDSVFAVPGGHWESGETLAQAVRREAYEEAGIDVRILGLVSVYEFFNPEKQKSYVSIGFEGVLVSGTPEVREPENKSSWGWYTPHAALALSLFTPDRVLIERALSKTIYIEPQ